MSKAAKAIFLTLLLIALDNTSVEAADPLDKSLVLSLNFTDGALFFEDARLAYGVPPNENPQGVYSVRVVNDDGTTGYESSFGDPRESFSETFYENGSIEAETFFEENTRFQLVVGVGEKTSAIKILDENESTRLTVYYAQIEPLAKALLCALPNKVCDVQYCGQDEPDCITQASKNEELQENKEGEKASSVSQQSQPLEESEKAVNQEKSGIGLDQAQSIVIALLALLILYVLANVFVKTLEKKNK